MQKKRQITIAVDFDGTLFSESKDGQFLVQPGAAIALSEFQAKGYRVVIHSCRTGIASKRGQIAQELRLMEKLLREHQIPYDAVHLGEKLVADLYIDDRAVFYSGDWTEAREAVRSRLSPHE